VVKIGTLFSGIGSPEEALKKIGIDYELSWACEIDKYARKSFLANHNPKVFYEDITKIDETKHEKVNGIIAGFPCQAFSIEGKRQGFQDKRGNLFFDLHRVLKAVKPDWFILENVKGLISHDNGNTFTVVNELLAKRINNQDLIFINKDSLRYNIFWKVLNTKDYKIPQNRERVFIIGFREDIIDFQFPEKQKLKLRLKDLLEDKVDEKYFLSKKMVDYIKNAKYRTDRNLIQDKNSFCMCLIAISSTPCIKMNNKIRYITPLECFRLQGFSDDFFERCKNAGVSDTQLYKQAGNSIAVNVLLELFKQVFKSVNKRCVCA